MSIQLAQEVQNQLSQCRKCSNAANKKTKQLLNNNGSDHFVAHMTETATSKFRIDGLNESLQNISRDIDDTVSVSVGVIINC